MPPELAGDVPQEDWNGLIDELNTVVPHLFRETVVLQIVLYLFFVVWIAVGATAISGLVGIGFFMSGFLIVAAMVVAWALYAAQLERTRTLKLEVILHGANDRFLVERTGWGVFLRSGVNLYSFICQGGDAERFTPPRRALVFERVVSREHWRELQEQNAAGGRRGVEDENPGDVEMGRGGGGAVSYTHLTLPTIYSV